MNRAMKINSQTLTFGRSLVFDATFLLVVAILAGLGWFAYQNTMAARVADQWTTHSYLVINELENLESSLENAETGARGFVITGKQEFLEPYQESLKQIDGHLAAMRQLTADNSRQQQRFKAMTPLIEAKLAQLNEIITLRETKGLEAAGEEVSTGKGNDLMEKIRVLSDAAREDEKQLLQVRAETKTRDARTTIRLAFLWVGAGGLTLLLLFSALKRELTRRCEAEIELRKHHDQLEDLVGARTQALQASEARLNFALETIRTGAWELDLVDHSANRTLSHDRIFGYETLLPQWTYEMAREHVLPEDREEL